MAVIDYVCQYIDNNAENCQFSFNKIMSNYPDNVNFSIRQAKRLLIGKFGYDMIVCRVKNDLILCYRSSCARILRDYYLEIQTSNITDARKT